MLKNHIKFIGFMGVLLGLSACAITPEQRAAQAQQQKLYEQQLQIQLAAQCDAPTAEIMRQHFQRPINLSETELKQLENQYVSKVSAPLFQACYKMAWQNYLSQERLRQIRHWGDGYWHDGFGFPFARPFWW